MRLSSNVEITSHEHNGLFLFLCLATNTHEEETNHATCAGPKRYGYRRDGHPALRGWVKEDEITQYTKCTLYNSDASYYNIDTTV